jgi:hypothetical protein
MVAGKDDDLAPAEGMTQGFAEGLGGSHGAAAGTVAQLEQVTKQHEAIDVIKGLQQGAARREVAQDVNARGAAEVQVGDD